MAKTLIICAHPDYKTSIANKAIIDELTKLLPEVETSILNEQYPDFKIDLAKEQKCLNEADNVIFEYPVNWFDAPSLMHRYLEQVFTYGYAYGPDGKALNGKKLVLSFTTGAPEAVYSASGPLGQPISAFMLPMATVGPYTGMNYLGPVVSYAMTAPDRNNKADVEKVIAKGKEHAGRVAQLLK